MAKEEIVDAFEDEEEVTVEEEEKATGKEKKKAKPVEQLKEEQVRNDKDDNNLYPKYLEYIELLGGWDGMGEPEKKKLNATFKIPGRFGGGASVDVSKLPPAHRKALDLIKTISDAAYAGVENNAMDSFNELQALNPGSKLSVEVYIKGKKAFVEGLPTE